MGITVTSAASSKQLTTVADFKTLMGITSSSDDTLIGKLIDRASAAMVAYCGREFAKETVIETLEGNGRPLIFLSRTPVVTLTSVSFEGVELQAEDYQLQDALSGRLYNKNGYWIYTGYAQDYSIAYTGGYVLPSFVSGTVNLPEDIQNAALEIAKTLYINRAKDSSISSESVPDVYTVSYGGSGAQAGKAITDNPVIQGLLAPYRRFKL